RMTRDNRRVVITGCGAVTPLGGTAATTWDGLAAGRSGVRPIELFDAQTYPVRIAGQVPDLDADALELPGAEELSRQGRFGLAAAAEAIRDAGLDDPEIPPAGRGVCLGGTAGRPSLTVLAEILH